MTDKRLLIVCIARTVSIYVVSFSDKLVWREKVKNIELTTIDSESDPPEEFTGGNDVSGTRSCHRTSGCHVAEAEGCSGDVVCEDEGGQPITWLSHASKGGDQCHDCSLRGGREKVSSKCFSSHSNICTLSGTKVNLL